MNATIAEPTPSMQAGADVLLEDPTRWTHARRKSDGREFWIVRGRTSTYYTARGGDACTCPGWQRRHLCSHSPTATMREARQAARRAHRFTCTTSGCHEATEIAGALCRGCAARKRRLAAELFGAAAAAPGGCGPGTAAVAFSRPPRPV